MPFFLLNKNSELQSDGGFLPPSPPDFAGQVAKVVVFLTTANLNKERKRKTLIMGTDEWIEFGLILVSSFMAIKLFDNVIFSFFDGLVNNSFLRKYLFGSNNAK